MNSPTDVLADDHTALLTEITPTDGRTRPILDPATGEEVGLAPVHTLEDLERAVDAAPAAQPAWAALGHERAQRVAACGPPTRSRRTPRRSRELLIPRAGQAAERPERTIRGRRCVRVVARGRSDPARGRGRLRRRRHPRRGALPPDRRRRRDRAVELADDDHRLADRTGAAHGQHRRRQAVGVHAAERARPGRRHQRASCPRAC